MQEECKTCDNFCNHYLPTIEVIRLWKRCLGSSPLLCRVKSMLSWRWKGSPGPDHPSPEKIHARDKYGQCLSKWLSHMANCSSGSQCRVRGLDRFVHGKVTATRCYECDLEFPGGQDPVKQNFRLWTQSFNRK